MIWHIKIRLKLWTKDELVSYFGEKLSTLQGSVGQQWLEVQLFGNDSSENTISHINRVFNASYAAELRNISGHACLRRI
jgi:hypothetical protein